MSDKPRGREKSMAQPDWLMSSSSAHRGLRDARAGRVKNSLPGFELTSTTAMPSGLAVSVSQSRNFVEGTWGAAPPGVLRRAYPETGRRLKPWLMAEHLS